MPARLMAFFSGTNGLIAKFVLLGCFNALVVWAATVLATHHKWVALVVVAIAAAAIDVIYIIPRESLIPAKFLIPGTIFLIGFTVIPIIYTINIAFTNYSTGHILVKSEAIEQIQLRALSQPKNGKTYTLSPARDAGGKLVLLLVDDKTHQPALGTPAGLKPLAASDVTIQGGAITAATGYKLLKGAALFSLDTELNDYRVPLPGGSAIHPEGSDFAVQLQPDKKYDAKADTFTSTAGVVYHDNGAGSFATDQGKALEPGWKTYNGFKQFSKIVTDPLYRRPFLRVLLWTVVFAMSTVIFAFALGLFLAITLSKPGLKLRRTQRAILVLPFAIPAFLSVLVWQGLLNDEFGIVNQTLHTNIPWLFDPTWAKVSCILVNVWLGFPYWFLVCTGALLAVPDELTEAARVDGAGPLQVFRKVTLPLLLVATAPLLIASFAFNFNNFNNIYFLTGGGPYEVSQTVAGSTDILISYTYKIAFQGGSGAQYGLAAAVSIFIFFIVAGISALSFWRTRALEEIR
jgi:arabinogalactan oligomer/maltooligosaccharide transport system permease protein